MSESISVPRTGDAPLRFGGDQLAESEGRHFRGQEQSRWHDLRLYRTAGGRYVLQIAYRTCWQGEGDHDEAVVCDSHDEVVAELRAYIPTAHVGGFPAGDAYAERQARLLASVQARYGAQVGELLHAAGGGFAEEVG